MKPPACATIFFLMLFTAGISAIGATVPATTLPTPPNTPAGWEARAPRNEIAPAFSVERHGNDVLLVLGSESSNGCNGHWSTTLPVSGGEYYHFQAFRLAENLATPSRSALVRIEWSDDQGRKVHSAEKINPLYSGPGPDIARPDFPRDKSTDAEGWVEVSDTYRAPDKATRAEIQLHLRWAPDGRVAWRSVSLTKCPPPPARKIKLAALHANLREGKSPADNLATLAPLIDEAGNQGADLVVLPECVDTKGTGLNIAQGADSLDACTRFLGEYAKKHDMYIVAGLHERDNDLIYNVAVLLGPGGTVEGSYRKCTLPREEIASGLQPGNDYPVFDTRFGKLGMMVCYDVFFPEVARELALNGAEVIAVPVWGANPTLASARCIENHVFLVTSTYTNHHHNWMKTAVWNREGERIAEAIKWDSVIIAEVDLSERTYWRSLGDFQSRIQREMPLVPKTSSPTVVPPPESDF